MLSLSSNIMKAENICDLLKLGVTSDAICKVHVSQNCGQLVLVTIVNGQCVCVLLQHIILDILPCTATIVILLVEPVNVLVLIWL